MTVLEQKFMEQMPLLLRQLIFELKAVHEQLEKLNAKEETE